MNSEYLSGLEFLPPMTVSTAEMNLIPLAKNVMPQLMSLHEGEEVTNGLTPSYSICCTVYMMLRDPCPMLVKNSQDRKAGKETGVNRELSRTGRQEKKQVLVKISQGS